MTHARATADGPNRSPRPDGCSRIQCGFLAPEHGKKPHWIREHRRGTSEGWARGDKPAGRRFRRSVGRVHLRKSSNATLPVLAGSLSPVDVVNTSPRSRCRARQVILAPGFSAWPMHVGAVREATAAHGPLPEIDVAEVRACAIRARARDFGVGYLHPSTLGHPGGWRHTVPASLHPHACAATLAASCAVTWGMHCGRSAASHSSSAG